MYSTPGTLHCKKPRLPFAHYNNFVGETKWNQGRNNWAPKWHHNKEVTTIAHQSHSIPNEISNNWDSQIRSRQWTKHCLQTEKRILLDLSALHTMPSQYNVQAGVFKHFLHASFFYIIQVYIHFWDPILNNVKCILSYFVTWKSDIPTLK